MTDAPIIAALRRRNYAVVEKLGESALARVYLLREGESFGLIVAKEIPPPQGVADHEFFRLFMAESARLKELQHPGLPRILESFVESGVCWLLREYVEGKTPEGVLMASKRAPSEKQILQWVINLCEIFSCLHRQDPPVLFGGLRPDNMIITPLGKIRITDYGLARFLPEALQKKYFTSMAPGYSSPELRRGLPMDIRSDIYSLGMLSYHLLTGVKAETSLPKEETLRRKRPDLSDRIVRALVRTVSLKPEERFQSVEELKDEIAGAVGLRHEPVITVEQERFECLGLSKSHEGSFVVKNTGTGNLNAIIESDQEWLTTKPEVHFGNVFRVHFTINIEKFESNTVYRGRIRIFCRNPDAENAVTVCASKKPGLFDVFRKRGGADF
jgi:serine/threonine protein kinase